MLLSSGMGEAPLEELDLNDPPFPLTKKDRDQLETRDEDFQRLRWDELKEIIGMAVSSATIT